MSHRAAPALERDGDVRELLPLLTLEEKVRLLTGKTVWRLHELPGIGLRSLTMSDGPVGVRGLGEVPGETSALFPSPSAVSATWDLDTAFAVGRAFAREARGHGVDAVLAPQVNIQRTPVGGRHFECYSEDPLLTSVIGTQVIRGIQDQGVAATVKHYIANDSETDRTEYVATLDAQTLREVYLAPFEHAVQVGEAWSVMAAYNQVDDGVESAQMTDHHHLVTELLKGELGFDGVVVSDWMATKSTEGSALGGLDVVMPGPGGPWEQKLLDAVRDGRVPESVIDDKVARILLLARRVGALDVPERPLDAGPALDDLITRVAAQSTVVLRRDEENPVWDRPSPARIALLGPNAVRPHVLGGGSSTVHPAHVVSPAEGLVARFPDAELVVRRGGDSRRLAPDLELAELTAAPDGALLEARFLDVDGELLETRRLTSWDGWLRDLGDEVHSVALRAELALRQPGVHRLEVATVGGYRIAIDGTVVAQHDAPAGVEVILDSSINTPEGYGGEVEIVEPRTVVVEAEHLVIRAGGYGAIIRAGFRHRTPGSDADTELAEAVEAARGAELTVVIVGTNEEVESEGWDRADLDLPGRQNELVERVLDVDPDAVIVVNAGAPVLLPWLERARTVLWVWFPGQEMGHALAAVLAGDLEPAGRLPWTLPADASDVPVPHALPGTDRRVVYTEGIHVGYRGWERLERTPAAPFGHGLGWSSFVYEQLETPEFTPAGELRVAVTVRNTGARDARETVQLYLEPPAQAAIERPVRWLAGFAGVDVAAGTSRRVVVTVPRRAFEAWDVAQDRWTTVAGDYWLGVGRSVRDLHLDTAVQVGNPDAQ
ncbi:beta-glucosidase family protein [Protaetiibacter larvae]|uniref:beta-glucosidase family protein n=1 Tax=Protaetiibacter larvae TaxID=2592654 RepID=UPI001FE6D50F|nr:glycoside hydrolase family 3 C-terminal domain-containing protein [Protaetiibacter larvae]